MICIYDGKIKNISGNQCKSVAEQVMKIEIEKIKNETGSIYR